jgi:hypothetical protein
MTTLFLIFEIFQDQLMYSTNFSPPCNVFTMLLCLDFYVLDLYVYLTHERHLLSSSIREYNMDANKETNH